MNYFNPRTFSSDWEILVVDRQNRCASSEKLMGFAGILNNECDLPIKVDWNSLEIPLGINYSYQQIRDRIWCATERAGQLLRAYDLDLFPCGAHPVDPMHNSSHIHIGTLLDESAGVYLENRLFRYVPVFAALAANSPAAQSMLGEYKSYRVRYQARGCTRPGNAREPHVAQPIWGTDACPKLFIAPTLEIRICDCASSRQVQAELATVVAAFVHHLGEEHEPYMPSAEEYREFCINRWAAAKYGMQATFRWQGQTKPVADILAKMLDACAEELQALGATRTDLTLVNTMIAKRICQADFGLGLLERYPEPFCFASAYAKLMRDWEIIDDYLTTAPTLDPAAVPDEQALLDIHLSMIGEGTYFYRTRDAMSFPPPSADAMIDRLVSEGAIVRETSPERGMLLSRRRH